MTEELFDDTVANKLTGHIKIFRSVMEHPLFKNRDPYSKREAWFDILLEVNNQPQVVKIKGMDILVDRGESIKSLDTWASRWRWDKSKVRRFLSTLENEGMIAFKSDTVTDTVTDTVKISKTTQKTTHLTVCKYDSYQDWRHPNETVKKIKTTQQPTQQPTPNNNIYTISNTIVKLLNSIGEKNFNSKTPATVAKIKERLREGFTEEDFEKVIHFKVQQWKSDKKMSKYIRPETLFGTKFESYLNEIPKATTVKPEEVWTDEKYEAFKKPQKPLIEFEV